MPSGAEARWARSKTSPADATITALYLVGDRTEIHAALPQRGFRDHRVRIVHASEVLTMADKPAAAPPGKKKPKQEA